MASENQQVPYLDYSSAIGSIFPALLAFGEK